MAEVLEGKMEAREGHVENGNVMIDNYNLLEK